MSEIVANAVRHMAQDGRLKAWAPAVAISVVGVVVTIVATLVVSSIVETRDRDRFDYAVEQAQDAVAGRLETYRALLQAGVGFVSAHNGPVDRQAFKAFATRLDLVTQYPGIQGFGYSVRLGSGSIEAAEARLAAWGVEGLRISPRQPRPEYHAIVHLEPMDRRNEAALGYDMFSEPTRRAAMEHARDSGALAASGRVQLVQEIDDAKQAGFLIYAPVYRGAATPPTISARRAALAGFVYSPFRIDDLMARVSTEERAQVRLEIYDGPPRAENLLHRSPGRRSAEPQFATDRQLDVAGRTWTMRYTASPELIATSGRPVIGFIFAGGCLATLLLSLVAAAQGRARLEADTAASENARLFQAAQSELSARTEAESHQRLLLDELNHRVKNTLATVQSIAAQTFRATPDPLTFRHAFEGRVVALSQAHNLLSESNWRGVSITDLVRRELAPHGVDDRERVEIRGDPVWLSPSAAVAIGMAIHELATNASKHGALSNASGQVSVCWNVEDRDGDPRLKLTWQETGGPTVQPPRRRGFGSRMIEQGLRHQLQGEAVLHFEPQGLRCELDASLAECPPHRAADA